MNRRSITWSFSFLAALLLLCHPLVRSAADQTYEDMKMLVEVLNLVRDNYVQDVDTHKLIYGAASGMVRVLDPFSQFLEPDAHKEMKTETEGEFGGLGIRIAIRDNILTVITPLPGTPAYRHGILPGDKIVKINDETTQDITIEQAVKRLRGAPGSKVTITIGREGEKELKDIVLTRELIKIESIKYKMLDSNIGYVRLTEFTQRSAQDFDTALKGLKAKGMTNLIVDLRNNPGGLLNVAVDTCRLFIGSNKLIVYTQGRRQPRQEFRADAQAAYGTVPMVVLVNHGSASGSEIFAGCLQDYHRALILGSETFGKGSVQSVIPLADGSGLRLTTAKYYTPSGRTFHRDEKTGKGGITPDILIDVPRDVEIKLQAQEEEIFGKTPAVIKPEKTDPKTEAPVKDEALERAKETLKAREIFTKMKES
ncbi:MAG: S41 family peptidase [Elusimicrobiota bacterium]|jgi:carboxyl-terminal processing protease